MKKILFLFIISAFFIATDKDANAQSMGDKLSGKILLQVEEHGEAWYVDTLSLNKYYLGRPSDAFYIMRQLALGISNKDFDSFKTIFPEKLAGKILLKVEDDGRAYYIDTINRNGHYLGRPSDAFSVMRSQGLGITNNDLNKIATANQSATSFQLISVDSKSTLVALDSLAVLEKQAFDKINDYRVSRGLAKFEWNDSIAKASRDHSADMASGAVTFGHDGFADRINLLRNELTLNAGAENVAYNKGYDDPAASAVTGWLNSPGHYDNIVGDFRLSGVGVARSASGSYYFTQIFLK